MSANLDFVANKIAGVAAIPLEPTSRSSRPSSPNEIVNALWFLSLILSLASALIGLVAVQWHREHLCPSTRNVPLRTLPAIIQPSTEKHYKTSPDESIAGTQLVLEIAQAAAFAPGATLPVLRWRQKVKDNKADLKQVAEEAVSLAVVIYNHFEVSEDQGSWPRDDLILLLQKLINTLEDAEQLANARAKRNIFGRFFGSILDAKKIQEYRDNIENVRSHCNPVVQLQVIELRAKLAKRVEDTSEQRQKARQEQEATLAVHLKEFERLLYPKRAAPLSKPFTPELSQEYDQQHRIGRPVNKGSTMQRGIFIYEQ
ncbi:hypothetical protein CPB83DRAFT_841341 [Crepidotus variabilis]|uniref:DUF6535 domain-containing protein n=1 Tax=Crepidotus variabilis TaxID=179855 RepID=A0A9P6BC54_9AGAR|nr:hypothetical protein CPB83DRAFT_841341 [Crepidotus variabilis]